MTRLASLSLRPLLVAGMSLGLTTALGPVPSACLGVAHWYLTDGSWSGAACHFLPHPSIAKVGFRLAMALL